ncbi:hypothetical protein MH928_17365 [Flavobacterium sp. WW92]|uniref:hypothetical protein n=1 Tax=unclassified Flavobacterium TaxID=196869 RepID=UPI002225A9C9|nr:MULTISPECIES: hypothetical protein [unclassified Flavobacterium]WDO13078.1 hypothetical protein MH928_17365 [Flavobacterium sp. WW92]
MELIKKELKKIPYSLTKSELVKMCYPLSERKVRHRINTIIYDMRKNQESYRNLSMREIIATHQIERKEIVEYFETYGIPAGFEF